MEILFIVFGMIIGLLVAWFLNRRLADKIDKKIPKFVLKTAAYVVFVALGLSFALVNSIKPTLDKFIDGRINAIEIALNTRFPDTLLVLLKKTALDTLTPYLITLNVSIVTIFLISISTYIGIAVFLKR